MDKITLLAHLRDLAKTSADGGEEGAHLAADHALLGFIDDDEISTAFLKITRWYS